MVPEREQPQASCVLLEKVMLFVALKDYFNYIPKNVIIHSQEGAIPYIIVYASSHATIFFHLCGAGLGGQLVAVTVISEL